MLLLSLFHTELKNHLIKNWKKFTYHLQGDLRRSEWKDTIYSLFMWRQSFRTYGSIDSETSSASRLTSVLKTSTIFNNNQTNIQVCELKIFRKDLMLRTREITPWIELILLKSCAVSVDILTHVVSIERREFWMEKSNSCFFLYFWILWQLWNL